MSVEDRRRPTVLCVVDRPGWAHDRKTDALARSLADRYEIRKRFQSEVTAEDLESADSALLYYWMQIDRLGPLRDKLPKRLFVGICSHLELNGDARASGLSTINGMASAVFVNSLLLLTEFESMVARPIHYTPNGVDTEFFRPPTIATPARPLRVGWAGSFGNHGSAHRGVNEVIAPAVASLEGTELHLAVREEHWRSQQEMLDFYQSIDVYVCASLNEGTPNPCLEAAACGLPVITTRVGNMPELIRDGENGYFVERDAADVAAKLRLLRDNAELRKSLGQNARAIIQSWDWHLQADRYDAMFRTILGEPVAR